eukprot:jgi/Mesen1/5033/ME000025S04431
MAEVTNGDEASTNGMSKFSCARCGKPSNLHSQECFKASWGAHKSVHKAGSPAAADALAQGWLFCLERGAARTLSMPSFNWTGELRPYPISPMRTVPKHIARPDWASTGIPVIEPNSRWQTSVEIKSADEIARLRKTCKVAREALDAAARATRVGVTTDEIDRVVHDFIVAAGLLTKLSATAFPMPAGGMRKGRALQDGDIVNVDISVFKDGVHEADLNETFLVGQGSVESKHLIRTTLECLDKAIAFVKPGVRYRDVGEVVSRHATLAGLSVVRSYCGHGIGELFHCAPNIPHYANNKAVGVMKAGQVFTIEPMINMGHWQDQMWPDKWTAVTRDGKRSAQFEHTLLVTEGGCEVLTARLSSSPQIFPWANS